MTRTMRDTGNKMMGNMVVRNIVEEESAGPAEKGTIDSGDGATNESPCVLAEVRHSRIGMVEISEHNNPVVREQVRNGVVLDDSGEVGQGNPVPHQGSHYPEPNIGSDNLPELLFLEKRRIWRVMLSLGLERSRAEQ